MRSFGMIYIVSVACCSAGTANDDDVDENFKYLMVIDQFWRSWVRIPFNLGQIFCSLPPFVLGL